MRKILFALLFVFSAPQAFAQNADLFDDMTNTLFGDENLPEPQGDILEASKAEAPAPKADTAKADAPAASKTSEPMVSAFSNGAAPAETSGAYSDEKREEEGLSDKLSSLLSSIMPGSQGSAEGGADAPAITRQTRLRNINTFDIAGMKLRMTPDEAIEAAISHGYTLKNEDKVVSNFVKWRSERECMDAGVYIYRMKQDCVVDMAKETGDYYTSFVEFEKPDTHEALRAYFTSSFSGNKLYRVHYVNYGDNSLGDSQSSRYIKSKRRDEFYVWLLRKYGMPDARKSLYWGDGQRGSPYLKAYTSGSAIDFHIAMENPAMPYEDSVAMKKSDVKTVSYSKFSF